MKIKILNQFYCTNPGIGLYKESSFFVLGSDFYLNYSV